MATAASSGAASKLVVFQFDPAAAIIERDALPVTATAARARLSSGAFTVQPGTTQLRLQPYLNAPATFHLLPGRCPTGHLAVEDLARPTAGRGPLNRFLRALRPGGVFRTTCNDAHSSIPPVVATICEQAPQSSATVPVSRDDKLRPDVWRVLAPRRAVRYSSRL